MANPAQKFLARISLNLLYPQGIPQKWPIRFLSWLISYGRFIVIAVEVLVLVTFAMRFKLDAELATLKEKIDSRVPFIESLAAEEAMIKQTQLRLSQVRKKYTNLPPWQETLTEISDQTPQQARLTSLTFERVSNTTNLQFKLTAQAATHTDLAIFLNGLKNSPQFTGVTLANINFDERELIFTITGTTK